MLQSPLTGTAVYIYPLTQTVALGSNFEVDVVVANVTNLGAFEFTLCLRPGPGPALTASVRAPSWGAPGARSAACRRCRAEGSVRFTCVTLGR